MPRGARTIQVLLDEVEDWQGDPVDDPDVEEPATRDITGCIIVPRTHPDDAQQIVEGFQVFVPPDQVPPEPEDEIRFNGVVWQIDGSVGPYEKKSGDIVGSLFVVKRLR